MGCYGNPHVQTPHFDAFARQGLTLHTAISGTPLCRPFRAALMTGCYGHRNGMLANKSALNFGVDTDVEWSGGQWTPGDLATLGQLFRSAGYRCGYVGKWHLGDVSIDAGPLRFGFDDYWAAATQLTHNYAKWNYFTGKDQLVSGEGFFRPVMESDLALEFIRDGGPEPWFMALSWGPPHEPLKPPKGYAAPYEDVPAPPNVGTYALRAGKKLPLYYGLVAALDEEFGRLLAKLDELGLSDDTIVVYTSDHGTMLGSHDAMGKELPYSESTHVPFLIRWPGRIAPGAESTMPLGSVDILPTLAELAGLGVPEGIHGRSFAGHVLGRPDAPRQDATYLAVWEPEKRRARPWRGVRTERHLYARYRRGPWLLFDVLRDPFEMDNLVRTEPALVEEMDGRVAEMMERYGDRWEVG